MALMIASSVLAGLREVAKQLRILTCSGVRRPLMLCRTGYDPTGGLYLTTGWWNSANAITALANYSRVSGSHEYLPVFANTLSAAQSGPQGATGFLNKYYDDEGWWALAWIDIFDLTGDTHYLQTASEIFQDMQRGWDASTCGGSILWSKDKSNKNAIENELFLVVAASLPNRESDEPARSMDLNWAPKEWEWFQKAALDENL